MIRLSDRVPVRSAVASARLWQYFCRSGGMIRMQPSVRETDSGQSDIFQQVAAIVLPLTRFGEASLDNRDISVHPVGLSALQVFAVSFDSTRQTSVGPLPSGVRNISTGPELSAEIGRLLSAERQALPVRLERWQQKNQSPHARLDPASCFGGATPIGYDHQCGTCGGRCRVVCSGCAGRGQLTCTSCGGHGRIQCWGCGGKGWSQCGYCGGSGRQVNNGNLSASNFQACNSCNASGRRPCGGCGGAGKVQCSHCGGRQKITCSTCKGGGAVDCRTCAATGRLTETAWLQCNVSEFLSIQTDCEDPEVVRDLATLASMEDFCGLARISEAHSRVTDSKLERQYKGSTAVTVLSICVENSEIEILGYGDHQHIFDYKNIVGLLLQRDLDELNAAIAAAPIWPFISTPGLSESLKNFLLSRANDGILEAPAATMPEAGNSGKPMHHTIVSGKYRTEAASALRKAVARVYGHQIWSLTLPAFGVPIVLLAIARFFFWERMAAWEWAAVSASAGMVAGLGAQWVASGGLCSRYGSPVGARLGKAIAKAGIQNAWRIAAILSALAGSALTLWALSYSAGS